MHALHGVGAMPPRKHAHLPTGHRNQLLMNTCAQTEIQGVAEIFQRLDVNGAGLVAADRKDGDTA